MPEPLRTIENVPGTTFDPAKTDVIYAEDMNLIKEHIEEIETTVPKITISPTEPDTPAEGDIWVDTSGI